MDRKKVALVTLVGLLVVVLVIGAALGIYSLAVIYGTTTITLDESKTHTRQWKVSARRQRGLIRHWVQ